MIYLPSGHLSKRMMANRTGHESTAPDEEKLQAINQLSDAIKTCLDREQALRSLLTELDTARLRGEKVQDDLNALFAECEELRAVCRLNRRGHLDRLLDDSIENGCLTESQRDAFESFWDEIGWITPAVKGFERSQSGFDHWTNKDMDLDNTQEILAVEHRLGFGLDTIHDFTVPAPNFFADSVQRLHFLAQVLPQAIEQGDIDADGLEMILQTQSDLVEVIDQLEEVAADQNGFNGGGTNTCETGRKAAPDAESDKEADDPESTGEDKSTDVPIAFH